MLANPLPRPKLRGPPMPDPIITSADLHSQHGSTQRSAFHPVQVTYKKSNSEKTGTSKRGNAAEQQSGDDMPYMPESEITVEAEVKTETKTFVKVKSSPFREKTSPRSSSATRQLMMLDDFVSEIRGNSNDRLPPRPSVPSRSSHRNVAPPLRSRGRSNEPRSPTRAPPSTHINRSAKSASPARLRAPPRPEDASPRRIIQAERGTTTNMRPSSAPRPTLREPIIRDASPQVRSSDVAHSLSPRASSASPLRPTQVSADHSPRETMEANEMVLLKHESFSPTTSASTTPPSSPDRSGDGASGEGKDDDGSPGNMTKGSTSNMTKGSTFGSKIISATSSTPPISPTNRSTSTSSRQSSNSKHTLSPPSSGSVSSVEPVVPSTVMTKSTRVSGGGVSPDGGSVAASSISTALTGASKPGPVVAFQTLTELKRQINECIVALQSEVLLGDLEKQIEVASLIEQLASAALAVKTMGGGYHQ